MTDLIARIESADGPDRELDAVIWRFKLGDTTGEHWFSDGQGNVTKDDHAPSFTASIDAALTLVPEEMATEVLLDAIETENWLYHLPRYICIAALKARGV